MPSPSSLFYRYHVFCCTNERSPDHPRGSCSAKGSEKLRDYMKNKTKEAGIPLTRINASGCLDHCELGPCMAIYPDGVWYHYETTQDVDEIITSHLQQGKPVTRLQLSPGQKSLK